MHRTISLILVATALWAATPAEQAYRAQVEADWLRQEAVRFTSAATASTAEDAAGAVDGVKNGKWGFHCGQQADPWWQVDLGQARPLDRVLVWNRVETAGRCAKLRVLLSDDGKSWRQVYEHDGSLFYGVSDNKPLNVPLKGAAARWLRLQLPGTEHFCLDEVEVFGAADPQANIALGRPADQCSVSPWSVRHRPLGQTGLAREALERTIQSGTLLAADLAKSGVGTQAAMQAIATAKVALAGWDTLTEPQRTAAYLALRWAVRDAAMRNPLLTSDRLLFVKRAPGTFSHQSDQHYGWWSRPGGGLYVLDGLRSGDPQVRCLTPDLPPGSVMSPDLSPDGQKVLFAWCRYHEGLAGNPNKVDKDKLPEDGFYHLYQINVDGSGLRQLTRGRYDDFDSRWLPDGRVLFLSTRRGQFTQCTPATAQSTLDATLPDSYVRCGGDATRPVAVYTLHTMDADGGHLTPISPFESFEWTPTIANDGRVLYSRWDYVDRDNMPYMGLWSVHPDGTNVRTVYGNNSRQLHGVFEARSIPHSTKLVFTATAHHSIVGGSLLLLDPERGVDGEEPLTHLTPEVVYPEIQGWPATYYVNPWPLSERYYLCAWSDQPLNSQGGANPVNATGLYLYDAFGNLELLYRDPAISSCNPIPLEARTAPPNLASSARPDGPQEGQFWMANVYRGLDGVAPGAVKRLRVVTTPIKTQPNMNTPNLGGTADDPGKCVLGTVPVEPDGSAFFTVPSGVSVFFQALDADGLTIRTMRTLTAVQPGATQGCVGCHESRLTTAPKGRPAALGRGPSKLVPGPAGSWPLRFDRLVQPLLDRQCVSCHGAGAKTDLSPAHAYDTLFNYGHPNLREQVLARYRSGQSVAGDGEARNSALWALLAAGHQGVQLDADGRERLSTWIDTYGQRVGHYSDDEERDLERLKQQWAGMLAAR